MKKQYLESISFDNEVTTMKYVKTIYRILLEKPTIFKNSKYVKRMIKGNSKNIL